MPFGDIRFRIVPCEPVVFPPQIEYRLQSVFLDGLLQFTAGELAAPVYVAGDDGPDIASRAREITDADQDDRKRDDRQSKSSDDPLRVDRDASPVG